MHVVELIQLSDGSYAAHAGESHLGARAANRAAALRTLARALSDTPPPTNATEPWARPADAAPAEPRPAADRPFLFALPHPGHYALREFAHRRWLTPVHGFGQAAGQRNAEDEGPPQRP